MKPIHEARALAASVMLAFGLPAAASAAPASAPAAAAEVFEPAAVRADLSQLYALLRQSHYDLYARAPRRGYDALFDRLIAGIRTPLSKARTALLFQRFLAHGKIAHARVEGASAGYDTYLAKDGAVFPLRIRVKRGSVFVARNSSGVAGIAAGDELVSLNGERIARWLERGAAYLSADTPYMAHAMMEWDFPTLLWWQLGAVEAFDVVVRKPDGARRAFRLPALTRSEMTAAAKLQPPELDLGWTGRTARMLDDRIAYLRPGPFYNAEGGEELMYDNRAFTAFIDGAFRDFLAAGATALVIDLRNNPGGDNSFSDRMIAWFATRPFRFSSRFRIRVSPASTASNRRRLANARNDPTGITARLAAAYAAAKPGEIIDFEIPPATPRAGPRFEAPVYLLINRHSYSNTVSAAALVQDYGFGTIIGEETSDLATTYGAMESFTLPRTGLVVGYPKALIIRPSGSMRARGVVPDIRLEVPVVEGPRDPVLADAVRAVRAKGEVPGARRKKRNLADPASPSR